MKVNESMILNKLYFEKNPFVEGNLIEGKILDIVEHIAFIEVKDLGIIRAFVQEDLNHQKGEILTFIVKSSLPSKIELKPISNSIEHKESLELTNQSNYYLTSILKKFHIKDDPVSIEFLKNLIKYNVKMDKESIIGGIKILDKLEQILNLRKDERIILASPEKRMLNVEKEDIRNFIIMDKEENKYTLDLMSVEEIQLREREKDDITPIVREYLTKSSFRGRIDSDILKTIGFFIKFNIKPSLNNISCFLELKRDPFLFSEDFKILEQIINNKFTKIDKSTIISREGFKNLIEESLNKYKQTLDKIEELIKGDVSLIDKSSKKTIEGLRNKIEFIDEINKELTFVYVPLILDKNKFNSIITLLKGKEKRKNSNSRIYVFINLKTKRLGNIKASCEILNLNMNIKFNNINKEDVNLFKAKENKLKLLVESTGYKIKTIEYLFDKNDDILDYLIVNTKPIYYLDMQV